MAFDPSRLEYPFKPLTDPYTAPESIETIVVSLIAGMLDAADTAADGDMTPRHCADRAIDIVEACATELERRRKQRREKDDGE